MKKLSLILASLWLSLAPAAAQTLVPNLGAAGAVSDTDLLAIYQGASPLKKVTGAQLKLYAGQTAVRKTTTTSEALQNTDRNKLVTFDNSSPVACTIAQAGSGGLFDSTWAGSILNVNTGTVTCTAGGTSVFFGGGSSGNTLTLTAGQGCDLYSDGSTGYRAQCGKFGGGAPGGTSGQIQTNNGSGGFNGGNLSGDVTTNGSLVTTYQGPFPNYINNFWYFAPPASTLTTGNTFTASQIYCRLFQFPRIVTISTIGLNVTTGGGGNVRVGAYASSSGLPGALLSGTGDISTTATGNKSAALGASIQVGPGGSSTGRDVWFCINNDNATHILLAYSTGYNAASVMMGASTQNLMSSAGSITALDNISCSGGNCLPGASSAYGAMPASLAGSTWTYNITASRFPAMQYQVVSSP